jgi:hypothetical protein
MCNSDLKLKAVLNAILYKLRSFEEETISFKYKACFKRKRHCMMMAALESPISGHL